VERAMRSLVAIASGDAQTADVLCLSLKTALPKPYTYDHYAHYKSTMTCLSRVYEKNPQARTPAVEAMRIYLRNPQPEVVKLAAKILGALNPPPGDLLPYVQDTLSNANAGTQEAIAELAKKLE